VIASLTAGSGAGGNINVSADTILLNNDAIFNAVSSGTGTGGEIQLTARDQFVSRNSAVSASTKDADGGNVTIQAGNLVYLINSAIKTRVNGGTGNGGNILIDPPVVILDHSLISASAIGGNGGSMLVIADIFLADPTSNLTATSTLGISGTVSIEAPVTNLSGTIAPLPQGFLQAAALLAQRCAARMGGTSSTFVVAGRDGLPPEPGGLLPSPLYEAGPAGALAAAPAQEAPGAAEPVMERVLVAFHEPLRPAVQGSQRLVARALDRGCP
jgi:hypothetical protein